MKDIVHILQSKVSNDLKRDAHDPGSNNVLINNPGTGAHTMLKEAVQLAAASSNKVFVDVASLGPGQAMDPQAVLFLDIQASDLLAGLTALNEGPPTREDLSQALVKPSLSFSLTGVSPVDDYEQGLANHAVLDKLRLLERAPQSILVINLKGASASEINVAQAFCMERRTAGLDLSSSAFYLSATPAIAEQLHGVFKNKSSAFIVEPGDPSTRLATALSDRRDGAKSPGQPNPSSIGGP